MPIDFNIEAKRDDPQRVIQLNGVPTRFYASAEEFNLIVDAIARILGKESSLFKGTFDYMEELEEQFPLPEPGSTAHLRVVDGDDIFCRWDNTDKKWIQDGLVKDQPPISIDVAENIRAVLTAGGTKYYGTKDGVVGVFDLPVGGSTPVETANGFKINNFSNGYQGGLTWKPYADFEFEGNAFSVTKTINPTTADIPVGEKRFAAIVLNSDGTITLVYGPTAVNPSAPNIDSATQVIPDGGLILLSSGAAAPDGVSLNPIYTDNSGSAGGEWDASIFRGGARWNLAYDDNGNICIKGTALEGNDKIQLAAPAAIPIASFTELTFKIKNIAMDPANGETGGFALSATGTVIDSKGRAVTNTIMLPSLTTTGYDVTNTTDWQFISIKVPALNFVNIIGLSFGFDPANPVPPTILLDDIKYNDGSAPAGENFATVGYVERRVSETLQAAKDYADSLVVGGADHVHDSYDTIALMIAGQNDAENPQIDGEFYIAIDASADPTVDAGWALYEYLADGFGDLQDYRKLSEEESLDIIQYDYSQDIADVQAEVDALEVRVTALENAGGSGGGSTEEIGITPTGAIDGVNKIFTTPSAYQAGKLKVFRNGVRQKKDLDYTETSSTTFEFIEAPVVDGEGAETILIDYYAQ